MPKSLKGIALGILVVAVATFFVTTSLRIALNGLWLYDLGFDKYDIAATTGMDRAELSRVGKEIIRYFNDSEQLLNVRAVVHGQERDLFNATEIAHMEDVKGLVKGVFMWQWISLGYIVAFAVGGFILWRKELWPRLAKGLLGGSVLTVILLVVLGSASLINFDAIFTEFHVLSFANDFWQLDPTKDYLIMMFPDGFWLDAVMIVAAMTLGQALIVGTASAGYLWWRSRKTQQAPTLAVEGPPPN